MAYNRRFFLQKVVKIQEIVLECQQSGASLVWIYENHIRDEFHISKSTFDNYLGIPAKRELEKLTGSN